MGGFRSEVRDQPDQNGETPSLLKIQNYPGLVVYLKSQLLKRLRHKNHLNPGGGGCSEQRLCSLGDRVKLCLKKKRLLRWGDDSGLSGGLMSSQGLRER